MSFEHWSSPNGCHPDCPACAEELTAEEAEAQRKREQLERAAPALLAVCLEIANDPDVDLCHSERRIRLYAALTKAGVDISPPAERRSATPKA